MRAVASSSSIAAPCGNQTAIQGVINNETASNCAQNNEIAYAQGLNENQADPNVSCLLFPFDSLNSDELSEIECLELLFFLCSKRTDSRRLAAKAMETYGSLAKIFQRSGRELRETLGLDQVMAGMFAVTKSSMKHILTPDFSPRKEISSDTSLMDYLTLDLRQANQEILRIIYLDRKCKIIRDEELFRGTIDTVPIYPREIARRSLAYCASSIILAHNHLSEDPTPSAADVRATINIKAALLPLGIILHDHVIISYGPCFSMQECGLI